MAHIPIQFCSSCGAATRLSIPEDDNRERAVCTECKIIHYQNPFIVTGSLPVWEDKVLLCKRAMEPRYGTWTLPAGYMENKESVEQGAMRETWEEARARIKNLKLYTVLSVPRISQVYMIYRAELLSPDDFSPGS